MEYLVNIYKKYCDFLENYSDKRTTKWLIMDSPFPTLIITMLYVLIVKVMIPKYMKNRKEFCIKNCLQVYNIWHFSVNVSFFYLSSSLTYLAGYNWRCEPLDTSITGKPLMVIIEFAFPRINLKLLHPLYFYRLQMAPGGILYFDSQIWQRQ